ncbi:hypothetical protein C8Q76DRAFT_298616 [Earliella scabrosa]|nr:hypothetical protein C8Q76DRAFT_298616 [Earliella scabrosa]
MRAEARLRRGVRMGERRRTGGCREVRCAEVQARRTVGSRVNLDDDERGESEGDERGRWVQDSASSTQASRRRARGGHYAGIGPAAARGNREGGGRRAWSSGCRCRCRFCHSRAASASPNRLALWPRPVGTSAENGCGPELETCRQWDDLGTNGHCNRSSRARGVVCVRRAVGQQSQWLRGPSRGGEQLPCHYSLSTRPRANWSMLALNPSMLILSWCRTPLEVTACTSNSARTSSRLGSRSPAETSARSTGAFSVSFRSSSCLLRGPYFQTYPPNHLRRVSRLRLTSDVLSDPMHGTRTLPNPR